MMNKDKNNHDDNRFSRRRKLQWQEFRASAERHEIGYLYHSTAAGNLPEIIRAGGLLSRHGQELAGYRSEKYHGWGRKWEDLADYICLAFSPPRHLRDEKMPQTVLKIKREIIWREGTLFCPHNSARNWLSAAEIEARADLESLELLFRGEYGSALKRRDTELLAKRSIHLDTIESILFIDEKVLKKTRRKCLWKSPGRFLKNPRLFFKFKLGVK